MAYASRVALIGIVVLAGCGGTVTSSPAACDGAACTDDGVGFDDGIQRDTGIDPEDDGPPLIDSSVSDEGFPEVRPDTSLPDVPIVIDAMPPAVVDKLDLLLVIDNSISMSDKQSELSRRVPELIATLTNPTPDPITGTARNAVDIHVGVITSSIGSHGTSACAPEAGLPASNDDKARLLPRVGETLSGGYKVASPTSEPVAAACPALAAASPITWVYDTTKTAQFKGYPGGAESLQVATSCVVANAKEGGCGYEETWEALYHFLVDPAPYATAKVNCTFGISGDACGNNKIVVEGTDTTLLAQRAAFLRPDSVVAVVVLSDENDFSLKPAGLNWLPWGYGKGQMQHGWAKCKDVPDDFEPESAAEFMQLHTQYGCFSCFENGSDPNCTVPWATDPVNKDVDGRNLRGFHQVQRYGYNFLWSRQRYVDAFTKPAVLGSNGLVGANALFAGGQRSADMVIVATLVGVPQSLLQSGGTPLPQPLSAAAWAKIAGPIASRDPHMVESIGPRPGVAKFAGDRSIDSVNGGDRDVTDGDDLQYACIAPRSTTAQGNDCYGTGAETKNPLCGTGGTQPYFKAYPGLRHLRIARDLGANGYVGSICNSTYRPFIQGLVEKIRSRFKPG